MARLLNPRLQPFNTYLSTITFIWQIMAQSFTAGEIYIKSCGLFPLFG
jgi:hypothetical protein